MRIFGTLVCFCSQLKSLCDKKHLDEIAHGEHCSTFWLPHTTSLFCWRLSSYRFFSPRYYFEFLSFDILNFTITFWQKATDFCVQWQVKIVAMGSHKYPFIISINVSSDMFWISGFSWIGADILASYRKMLLPPIKWQHGKMDSVLLT